MSDGMKQLGNACISPTFKHEVVQRLGQGELSTVVSECFRALACILQRNWRQCFEAERTAYMALLEYFRDNNWVIPVLKVLSEELRLIATISDVGMNLSDNEKLREAEIALKNGFAAVAKDRTALSSPAAKKRAIFIVTNCLFKIYFRLNTLHNATKIINVVEGPGSVLNNLSVFPVCDVVTYKYYIGRLRMFEDNFEESRECLRLALMHTPKHKHVNRQRILASLVPVEMSLGIFPTDLIGSVYGLHQYVTLAVAAKSGNLRAFERCMQAHRMSLIRLGVFLVLERVKVICYRNLFKRVFREVGSSRLPLTNFQFVMNALSDEPVSLDEVECILANLIFQKKLNGYINHEHRMLVVSKKNPFPRDNVVRRPGDAVDA